MLISNVQFGFVDYEAKLKVTIGSRIKSEHRSNVKLMNIKEKSDTLS